MPSPKEERKLKKQVVSKTKGRPSSVAVVIEPTRKQRWSSDAAPDELTWMIDLAIDLMDGQGYSVSNVERGMAQNPTTVMFTREDR